MGCGASTVLVAAAAGGGAERQRRRRRRVQTRGYSEASSTAGLLVRRAQESEAGRRRGSKVSPEPKDEPAVVMPGSPSFRFYCQKAAAVDSLVAAADGGDGDSDGSVEVTEPPHPIKNELVAKDIRKTNNSSEVTESKANGWIKFRGLAIMAAAMYKLLCVKSCHSNSASGPAAAKPHP